MHSNPYARIIAIFEISKSGKDIDEREIRRILKKRPILVRSDGYGIHDIINERFDESFDTSTPIETIISQALTTCALGEIIPPEFDELNIFMSEIEKIYNMPLSDKETLEFRRRHFKKEVSAILESKSLEIRETIDHAKPIFERVNPVESWRTYTPEDFLELDYEKFQESIKIIDFDEYDKFKLFKDFIEAYVDMRVELELQ